MAIILSNLESAWLAGLLEGEGCFTFCLQHQNKRKKKRVYLPRLQLTMTDKDVIEKVTVLLNTNLVTYSRKTKGDKFIYSTTLARATDLSYVLNSILPFMCERRSQRILELLKYLGGKDR